MNWLRLCRTFPAALVVAVLAASSAHAFAPRSPQVPFVFGPLQGYFASIAEPINVATDQLNAQTWSTTIAGNSTFTILLKSNPTNSSVGVYNSNDPNPVPALFQVFPSAAAPGWYATCHFSGGSLVVSLFDNTAAFQGSTTYSVVDPNHFSFYIMSQFGLFFSQDLRNPGGLPQVLTYAGVRNYGDWFECFDALPFNPGTSVFDSVVLDLQSVIPTPTHNETWGGLKALYR